MKRKRIWIYLCLPSLLYTVGSLMLNYEQLQLLGSILILSGIISFFLGMFAFALYARSVKCPRCGNLIPEPQKQYHENKQVACWYCGTVIPWKPHSLFHSIFK